MAELEHRRAEAEGAKQRYLDLVQGLNSVVWEADAATGRFTFMSRRVEDLFGYPAERWLAEPGFWLERVHPEDRDYAAAVWRHALSDGRDFELEYRAVAADKRTIWIREAVRSTREGRAQGLGLRGLMWNITKRKKIERQLGHAKSELAVQLWDMNHLYRLSTELLSVSGLVPTLEEVLAAVMGIQGAEMGLLRLHDRERDELTVMAQVGLPKAYLERFASMPVQLIACGQSIAPGEMILVEDVDAEPSDVPCREAAKLGGYRAEFTLPLVRGDGEPLGAITTFFLDPHRPPDRQIRLVQRYAQLATVFIEAARLRDELVMGIRWEDKNTD